MTVLGMLRLGLKTNMFSYSSGGLKLKIKMLTGLDGK